MQRIARSFLSKRAGDSIPYTMAPKRPFPNGNALHRMLSDAARYSP